MTHSFKLMPLFLISCSSPRAIDYNGALINDGDVVTLAEKGAASDAYKANPNDTRCPVIDRRGLFSVHATRIQHVLNQNLTDCVQPSTLINWSAIPDEPIPLRVDAYLKAMGYY